VLERDRHAHKFGLQNGFRPHEADEHGREARRERVGGEESSSGTIGTKLSFIRPGAIPRSALRSSVTWEVSR
jgi:hypothetical protein